MKAEEMEELREVWENLDGNDLARALGICVLTGFFVFGGMIVLASVLMR